MFSFRASPEYNVASWSILVFYIVRFYASVILVPSTLCDYSNYWYAHDTRVINHVSLQCIVIDVRCSDITNDADNNLFSHWRVLYAAKLDNLYQLMIFMWIRPLFLFRGTFIYYSITSALIVFLLLMCWMYRWSFQAWTILAWGIPNGCSKSNFLINCWRWFTKSLVGILFHSCMCLAYHNFIDELWSIF